MLVNRMLAAATGCLLLAASAALADGATVNVLLWDRGGMSMGHMQGMPHMGLAMPLARMPMAMMGIATDEIEVPAGEVTFAVVNQSRVLGHEMVVAKVDDPTQPLPYDTEAEEVDEDAAGALGEVEILPPGESGEVTLRLDPGSYVLFCNVAGHYAAGMWAVLTVR